MQDLKNNKYSNKPLSTRSIEMLKPSDKIKVDIGENTGLRLKCSKTGIKTFTYRYTSPNTGKLVQVKIGNYPVVGLAEARSKLHELKAIRKSGRCPASEAKKFKQEQKQIAIKQISELSFTVHDLIELYLSEYIEDKMHAGKKIAGARKLKGQKEVRSTLYRDAVAVLGNLPAGKVNRKDVVNLINSVVSRGSHVQAGNLLRELTSAYEFAIGLGRFEDDFANPAVLAKASLRQSRIRLTSKRGTRYLSDDELLIFLNWLPGSAFTPTQKNILRFTLWTGCRTGEVCEAEWKYFNLEKGIWHIRATKTDAERFVQLPTQAVKFLEQLKLNTGLYPFPSQKTGLPIQQKSMTEQAWHLRKSNRMVDIAHWTPHDLRRSVRTGLSRLGCRSEVAEAVLGHSRSGIEGTYDLHEYELECKEWLQKWADHLENLISDKSHS